MGCRHLRLLFAVLVLAGCDKIFDLHDVAVVDGPPGVDAYMPVLGCSPTSLIDEEFDEPLPANWFTYITPNVTVSGGVAHFAPAADGYATVTSGRYFDLTDDRVTVEATIADSDPVSSFSIRLLPATPGDSLEVVHQGTDLTIDSTANGVPSEKWRMAYDATLYRYIRFANLAGTTTVETSANGTDFTVRATVTGGPWAGFVRLDVGAYRGAASPEIAADLYGVHGGTSTVGACPMRQLSDTFDGTALGPLWARTEYYNADLVEQNSAAEMTFHTDGGYANVAMSPATLYDMRGGSLSVEVPDMVDTTTTQDFTFGFVTFDRVFVSMLQRNGQLLAQRGSTTVGSATYDASAHRWWRIRQDVDGTVHWDAGPDGATYTEIGQATNVDGLEGVDIYMGIHGTATVATTARVTTFNPP